MKQQKMTLFGEVSRSEGQELIFYDVEHWTRIRRSGYEILCLETTLYLMEKGWITTINHEPDYEVIGLRGRDADNEFRPAFICFEVREQQELAHVIIGGVSSDNRGDGFYALLWKWFILYIQAMHPSVRKITGCYHVDNRSAASMNEKLGRKPVRITTEYSL